MTDDVSGAALRPMHLYGTGGDGKTFALCGIKEREEKMAHVTDTGTMWTRNAFFEVLKFIRDNRGKAALTENGAKDE